MNAAMVAIIGALFLPLFELRFGASSYDGIVGYLHAAAYGLLKPGILCCIAGSVGDFHARKA